MEDFSTRLRKAVDMAGISIRELSKRSGVNEHTIYSYISPERYGHNRNPRIQNLEAISGALGVSMDWLCGQTDEATLMHTRKKVLAEMVCALRNTGNIAQVSQKTPKTSRRIIKELIERYGMDEVDDISDDFILGFIYGRQIADMIVCEERDSIALPFL